METYGDMQTDIANTRIPYFSTLQMEDTIKEYGMTPVPEVDNIQLKGEGDDLKIPSAVGNEALPPQSTTNASKASPLHV